MAKRKSAYSPTTYEERLLAEYVRRRSSRSAMPFASLEDLLTSADGFGLVTATPMQRAICRVIEGRPLGDLRDWDEIVPAFGVTGADLERALAGKRPEEVVITAGVRGAKTMIAAANALMATQTCDLTGLADGEIPRYSVVSLEKDNATVLLSHLKGALMRPKLRALVVQDPGERWKEILDDMSENVVGQVFVWRPGVMLSDGSVTARPVEIRVVAGKRKAGGLISRWSVGLTLDEAPRMVGASDGVVNYEEQKAGVETRLRPGAQILSIGSHDVPYGPVYDIVQKEFGHPSPDRVVICTTGPMLNPSYWTPEYCEKVKRKNPRVYTTDVLGKFADAEQTLFPQEVIAKKMRRDMTGQDIPYERNHHYQAAMDPATRRNAWTLVICDRVGDVKRVVFRRQWQGTSETPLVTSVVLREIKSHLQRYRLNRVRTDQWCVDAIMSEAYTLGFFVEKLEMSQGEMHRTILNLAREADSGRISTPYDADFEKDFKLARGKAKVQGQVVVLPETSDKRHCDYVPPTALAMYGWLDDVSVDGPQPGTSAAEEAWEAEQIAREEAALLRKNDFMARWSGRDVPEEQLM